MLEISLDDLTLGYGYSSRLTYQYYYRFIEALKLPRLVIESNGYIPKFCSELMIDATTAQLAFKINQLYIEKQNTSGLDTRGIAAGAIYVACKLAKEIRSQQSIAGFAKVSDITLRSRAKEMEIILRKYKNEYFLPPQY
jgi:transcription initiation factor TFIIIB Brf1 subunit/transcription initiation factor TFIIB